MKNVYINEITKKHIDSLSANLPQSLLLYGQKGVGFSGVLDYILSKNHIINPIIVLPMKDEKVDVSAGSIGIKQIRDVLMGVNNIEVEKRAIVFDYAEKMTISAQNAFLKALEEPNNNIYFILLSHSFDSLLDTVLSRLTKIRVQKITSEMSKKMLSEFKIDDTTKLAQINFIAGGLPAEMSRLSLDSQLFEERTDIVKAARKVIESRDYESFMLLNKFADSREKAILLIDDIINLLKISLSKEPTTRHLEMLDSLLTARKSITQNSNIKLSLIRSMLI